MNRFQEVLADVFERRAEDRLDAETERDLIALAKEGDEEAFLALVYAYAPALRGAVKHYAAVLGEEDARQEAALGLLAAVHEWDAEKVTAEPRLAGRAHEAIRRTLAAAAADRSVFSIPERTLQRFYGILRRAGGDVDAALVIAPEYLMARETFLTVLGSLQTDSAEALGLAGEEDAIERAETLWASREVADAEDRLLVAQAFAAVDDREEVICRMAYGFTDYGDPVADPEIAHRLGMTKPTVQRQRVKALGKMREALGVGDLA